MMKNQCSFFNRCGNTSFLTLYSLLIFLLTVTDGFLLTPPTKSATLRNSQNHKNYFHLSTVSDTSSSHTLSTLLFSSSSDDYISITYPTPEDAAEMGCRDWPQQTKVGGFVEECRANQLLTRYVLDGTGDLEIYSYSQTRPVKVARLNPGTLVEVEGPLELVWNIDYGGEMIILTPTYEEAGSFVAVLIAMIAVCGALIAGVGS